MQCFQNTFLVGGVKNVMFYPTLFFIYFVFVFFLQHGREYRHNDTEEGRISTWTPTELSDLWQQSWPRQRNLAKQILALRFGPIQVDKVDGNEIMITLARRYKSSTLTTRLGDTVKWIWDFKRYPEVRRLRIYIV